MYSYSYSYSCTCRNLIAKLLILLILQLGLAEEFKKPIINARMEEVSEIDPGLKLIMQRRQVHIATDYTLL